MINYIKERLKLQKNYEKLFNSIGCEITKDNGNLVYFKHDEDSSGGSCIYYLNTGNIIRYSTSENFDIISFVQDKLNMDFKSSLDYIKTTLNIKNVTNREIMISRLRGDIAKEKNIELGEENIVDLNFYDKTISELFLEDNVSKFAQYYFDIRTTYCESRILIPWKNIKGDCVGVTGRANYNVLPNDMTKYTVIEKFKKRYYLYGLFENEEHIRNKEELYIFEAEKSVMKCFDNGIRNCVSVGSSSLSKEQIKIIKDLNIKNVIICFDESLVVESVFKICKSLKDNGINSSYVYDKHNEILPSGCKCSPIDLGLKNFLKLKEKCLIKYIDNI